MRVFIKRGNLRTEEERRQHELSQVQGTAPAAIQRTVQDVPVGHDAGEATAKPAFRRKKVVGEKGRREEVASAKG